MLRYIVCLLLIVTHCNSKKNFTLDSIEWNLNIQGFISTWREGGIWFFLSKINDLFKKSDFWRGSYKFLMQNKRFFVRNKRFLSLIWKLHISVQNKHFFLEQKQFYSKIRNYVFSCYRFCYRLIVCHPTFTPDLNFLNLERRRGPELNSYFLFFPFL